MVQGVPQGKREITVSFETKFRFPSACAARALLNPTRESRSFFYLEETKALAVLASVNIIVKFHGVSYYIGRMLHGSIERKQD